MNEQSPPNTSLTAKRRVGHWPLRSDCRDTTSHARHGEPHAIRFEDGAVFDGISSSIRLADVAETDGTRPFTLSMEFAVDDDRGFLPGGLCSRYDEARMEGWHLSVLTQAGVTSSQSNWRHLQFGVSTGRAADQWRDWGTPGDSRLICALCVHDGHLYAGTFDDARDHRGRVYRMEYNGNWTDCGNPDNSNSVFALAEFKGRLYAGTMRYRASGSALPNSPNQEPGGRIYRYDGDGTWTWFAELPVADNDSVGSLAVYEDRLIAMAYYPYGVFAYAEDGSCEALGAPGPEGATRGYVLAPYRGKLYVGCTLSGGVYRRTLQTPWEYCGTIPQCTQVYCFSAYHNEWLMGIWPEARMARYEGGTDWSDFGLLGSEKEVMGISVFNGRLYAGTLPGGHVYRYAGDRKWDLVGVLEQPNPEQKYRRVWSMAVFRGQLFAGTLPGGKVWSLKNDPLATDDSGLSSGWHKVTAVYEDRLLSLYVDGQRVSSAEMAHSQGADVSSFPLMLGKGPQCHFSGRIREVEVFDYAMTKEEVAGI